MYSYLTFTFVDDEAKTAFEKNFAVKSHAPGYDSLNIKGYKLIATNRDFDMDQISLLKDDDIDIETTNDIIAKMGLYAKVQAELIEDCVDFTFCRIVKERMVYSKLLFEGPVENTKTILSSPVENFEMHKGVSFADSYLRIIIDKNEKDGKLTVDLKGELVTVTEDDRAIALKGLWNFGDKTNGDIKVEGDMQGIYDNVFNVGLIDISNLQADTTIFNNGTLANFSLKGLGIFGADCYTQETLIKALQDQDSGPPDKIINFTNVNKQEDKSVPVLNNECKDAYLTFEFDHNDINHNHIKGVVSFKNPEDVLKTTLNIKSDDAVPDLVRNIKFPYGLTLDYSYENAKANKPMLFNGQMNFMNVHTHGEYSLYSWNYTSLVNIELPTVKIGGGNFQFITHDDLFYHYNLNDDEDSKEFDSRTLDIRANFDDLKKKNTLKFMLEKGKLDQSQILLESNILIFEMVGRVSTYLKEDLMSFTLEGRPFKGVFESKTTVEVKPVDDLEAETNSVLKMELLQNDHLKDLEHWTNYNLQTWVTRIIKVTEEAKILRDKFNSELKLKQDAYIPEDQCESYEQCEEMPSIICNEYAQKAVCKEEKEVCLTMTQVCVQQTEVCTRTDKEGECQEKMLKCDKWENKCKDDETTTV